MDAGRRHYFMMSISSSSSQVQSVTEAELEPRVYTLLIRLQETYSTSLIFFFLDRLNRHEFE